MLKNSESARAMIIAASPPVIAAWVMLRRRNLETGARAVTTPMLRMMVFLHLMVPLWGHR
jgi:uncharacterized membrane protein YozB (DUF420 family)